MNKKKNRHKWDKKELKAAYLFTLPFPIYLISRKADEFLSYTHIV